MTKRAVAILSLVVVMIVWGSAVTVTKAAVAHVPPFTFALLRFAVASAVLLPLTRMRSSTQVSFPPSAWRTLAAMGICGIPLFYGPSNLALYYASATQGVIIQSVIPVVTAAIAVLTLQEQPSAKRLAGIAVSLGGVALVVVGADSGGNASNPLLGSALMLAAVVGWAFYTVFAKRLAGADQLQVTAYSTVIGALFLVPPVLLELHGRGLPRLSGQDWMSVLYLGGVSTAAGHLLYNRSLAHLDASQAATFINLTPIAGVATAVLFLGEAAAGWQLAGGALVLFGVWLAT